MPKKLTQERLKQLLSYDPDTGLWVWIWCPPPNQRRTGTQAGYTRSDGYNLIRIDKVAYYCSRLAFLYMNGEWPKDEVDHKDRDSNNDQWSNLREATSSQNKYNRSPNGLRGVYRKGDKWFAHINNEYLGIFDTEEEAVAVRDSAASNLHGDFAVLNSTETIQ